jgi:hypothetical protein
VVVTYTLEDDFNTVGPYQFTLTVNNDPPYVTLFISDFSASAGCAIAVTRSVIATDPEGDSVKMNVITTGIPTYITWSGMTFSVHPPAGLAPQSTLIKYTLSD